MKKIIFVTSTRADYGKIKSLVSVMQNDRNYKVFIFVTGMHLQQKYGYTYQEIALKKYSNLHKFINTSKDSTMDIN